MALDANVTKKKHKTPILPFDTIITTIMLTPYLGMQQQHQPQPRAATGIRQS